MKKMALLLLIIVSANCAKAQIYLTKSSGIDFFSATSMEDIQAENKAATSILNTVTNEVVLKIPIAGFKFKKPLMEEHFNENYMETTKYPYANFKGSISKPLDYAKDGTYDVTATGKMNMHGVDKDETIKGKLIVKGDELTIIVEKHKLFLKDYNIEIPKLVAKVISEFIEVNYIGIYNPYLKK